MLRGQSRLCRVRLLLTLFSDERRPPSVFASEVNTSPNSSFSDLFVLFLLQARPIPYAAAVASRFHGVLC